MSCFSRKNGKVLSCWMGLRAVGFLFPWSYVAPCVSTSGWDWSLCQANSAVRLYLKSLLMLVYPGWNQDTDRNVLFSHLHITTGQQQLKLDCTHRYKFSQLLAKTDSLLLPWSDPFPQAFALASLTQSHPPVKGCSFCYQCCIPTGLCSPHLQTGS